MTQSSTTTADSDTVTLTEPSQQLALASHALPLVVDDLSHRYPPPRGARKSTSRKRKSAQQPIDADRSAAAVRPALDHVSLSIKPGEIFGILGPNGSGKTTLFRVLSTLLTPTSGTIRVFGHDVHTDPDRVRQHLGVVFQMASLDDHLSAYENLLTQGHLYGLRGQPLQQRIDHLLTTFDLQARRDDWTGQFSGGMRRRVELAKALLHQPGLLVLDEPSTGLDPSARIDLWRQLTDLRAKGVTVALTTHLMDEADRCDRLAVMSQGKLVALDTPANLKARIGGDVVTIEPENTDGLSVSEMAQEIHQRWGPWRTGTEPTVVDGKIRLERDQGAAFIATVAGGLPGRVRSLSVGKPTLEDVFVRLTGQKLWQAADEVTH
jgi:ABC-2 type transport system ATP-binding protein